MPWRSTCSMDEKEKFIAMWLAAGTQRCMSELCRSFDISRKTGYKWIARYHRGGLPALVDRSHAPHHQRLAVPVGIERQILGVRAKHPRWGPLKIEAWLTYRQPHTPWPAASTIGALLKRAGLTVPRRRRRQRACGTASLTPAGAANDVWAADFKGWFRTGDGRRCDPLTISDLQSRYLLRCQAVGTAQVELVRPIFEATFRDYGLPAVIRTDNGTPFAGPSGLSRLAVWWIRLGIRPERIAPGHPEQNGAHERMHRTLKAETATPPRATLRAQQSAFDHFRRLYNHERPHAALGQTPPVTVYTTSARPYPARLPAVEYPATFVIRRTHARGTIKWGGRRVFISEALAGEPVGVEEVADGQWQLWFGPVKLGWIDARRPGSMQRTPRVLPISSV